MVLLHVDIGEFLYRRMVCSAIRERVDKELEQLPHQKARRRTAYADQINYVLAIEVTGGLIRRAGIDQLCRVVVFRQVEDKLIIIGIGRFAWVKEFPAGEGA